MIRKECHVKLEENYNFMIQELQEAQVLLEALRRQAADSVTKQELSVARTKVEELQGSLAELQSKASLQIESAGQLTPRPPWDEMLRRPRGLKSTAELLGEICRQNVSLTENMSRLQGDCAAAEAAVYEKYKLLPGKEERKEKDQSKDAKENKKGKKEMKDDKKVSKGAKKSAKKSKAL